MTEKTDIRDSNEKVVEIEMELLRTLWRQCKAGPALYQNIVGSGKEYYSFHQKEAIAIFKEIPLERMHGIPAIGIRVVDPRNLDDGVEMDVLIGKRIDLDILHYVPEIADNWQAQQMIR